MAVQIAAAPGQYKPQQLQTPLRQQQAQSPGIGQQAQSAALGAATQAGTKFAEKQLTSALGGAAAGGVPGGGAIKGILAGDPGESIKGIGTEIAGQALGAALTPVLGPLGPIAGKGLSSLIGGLFNDGGEIPQGLNEGGWLSKLFRNPNREKAKAGGWYGGTEKKNDGGPIMLNHGGPLAEGNPNGYNEGGPGVGATPIKRVADEQKIELDKMTWDRMEGRKDQQMMMDEKRKEIAFGEEQGRKAEAHTEAMKMKKASATTNKAPLSGG